MTKDLKTLLEQVRAAFAAEAAAAPAGIDVKAKDGTAYKVASLAVGEVVTLADGTPAPAGEIELEDGTEITVDADGKITEIETVTESQESPEAFAPDKGGAAPTDKPIDKPADVPTAVTRDEFNALVDRVTALEKIVSGNVTASNGFGNTLSAMFALVEAMSEESTAAATSPIKSNTFAAMVDEKAKAKIALSETIRNAGIVPKKK